MDSFYEPGTDGMPHCCYEISELYKKHSVTQLEAPEVCTKNSIMLQELGPLSPLNWHWAGQRVSL